MNIQNINEIEDITERLRTCIRTGYLYIHIYIFICIYIYVYINEIILNFNLFNILMYIYIYYL